MRCVKVRRARKNACVRSRRLAFVPPSGAVSPTGVGPVISINMSHRNEVLEETPDAYVMMLEKGLWRVASNVSAVYD